MQVQESTSLCDIKYKIVFLGEMGVGKTSIIERFVKDSFDIGNNPTVGIDFLCRNMVYQNVPYRFQLWDTAGQQKYKSLVPAYLRDAVCVIFVFDLSRECTLANLGSWMQLFRENQSEHAIAILAGNKQDLVDENEPKVAKDAIEQFIFREQIQYCSLSAKTGQGVDQIFETIIQEIKNKSITAKIRSDISEEGQINNIINQYNQLKLKQQKRKYQCCYI